MKTVTHRDNGSRFDVRVALDKATGFKFPADHPTVAAKDGSKSYSIPVTYYELDKADDNRTIADVVAELKSKGLADPIAEMNSGLRLGFGEVAKAPYRVKKSGASMAEILGWFATATPEQIATFKAKSPADGAIYVAEQMAESK